MTLRAVRVMRRWWTEEAGAAAAEFAMFIVFLVPLLLNLIDLGYYVYVRMQVENAAQSGAQAAWANCSKDPASATNCPNLSTAVTSAVQSTNLGTGVTWTNSANMWSGTPPGVTFYCPNSATNSLVQQNAKTPACSSTTSTGTAPGTYAKISVSYTFTPIFSGATIASLLPATITSTTYQRLY